MMRDFFNNLRRLDIESIYNTFVGLPPQQQTIALVGTIVAVLLLTILPISLAGSQLGALETDVTHAQKRIDDAVVEITKYNEAKNRMTQIEQQFARQSGESLLAVIPRLATAAGVTSETPTEGLPESFDVYEVEKVSFTVPSAPLDQVVKFIYQLESNPQRIIRINKLKITPSYQSRTQLKAEFREVSAYKLVGQAK